MVIPALVICGVIEGYISPDPDIGWLSRTLIGVGWMVIFVALLRGMHGVRLFDPRPDPVLDSDLPLAPQARVPAP